MWCEWVECGLNPCSASHISHRLSMQGVLKCSLYLSDIVPPSIRSTGSSERSVILHKSISLQCMASGIPAPSITWLRDGRPVSTAQGHLKVTFQLRRSTALPCPGILSYSPVPDIQHLFQLTRLRHPSVFLCRQLESASRVLKIVKAALEDAGRYTCVATNAAGEAQQHIRLSVHGMRYGLSR